MRVAVVLEIEELLFDTLDHRSHALREALRSEGVEADPSDVRQAHTGVPSHLALTRLALPALRDPVVHDLVMRRASDLFRQAATQSPPMFDPLAATALARLSVELPVGVVTRAEQSDACAWLVSAGLDSCLSAVRSLADVVPAEYHSVWREVTTRLYGDRTVALAPAALLPSAARAGLVTVRVASASEILGADPHALLSGIDAAFIASLL
jgi:phosphoglycolate phosphatase-like HAD superfamily hydrolase